MKTKRNEIEKEVTKIINEWGNNAPFYISLYLERIVSGELMDYKNSEWEKSINKITEKWGK